MYSNIVRVHSFIQKTKIAKEPLVEEEDHNNKNETNTQKEDGNDMDCDLVKDNDNTQHSETTEDSKKREKPTP